MTARPRVHVECATEPKEKRTVADYARVDSSPGVKVRVDFDLHDHARALRQLERVVANVRSQIEDVRQ